MSAVGFGQNTLCIHCVVQKRINKQIYIYKYNFLIKIIRLHTKYAETSVIRMFGEFVVNAGAANVQFLIVVSAEDIVFEACHWLKDVSCLLWRAHTLRCRQERGEFRDTSLKEDTL